MIEDKSFNAFLKEKLEEDIEVPAVVCARRRSVFGFYRPMLMAASLAVVCGFAALMIADRHETMREEGVVRVIELLDDSETIVSMGTFADKLLAWQDAPFAEIVD